MAERFTIRILGTGAVGSLLGGLLGLRGQNVLFSGLEEEMNVVARAGLRLLLPSGWALYQPVRPWSGERVDLVLVAMKRTLLRQTGRRSGKTFREEWGIHPEERLLFLNGDPGDTPSLDPAGAKPSRCLTLLEAVRLHPPEVELHSERPVLLTEKDPFSVALFKMLKPYGFQVQETGDMAAAGWALFLRQLLELPAALCGMPLPYFLSYAEGRDIARKVLEEGLAVLTRCRRKPGPLPALDPLELLRELNDPKARPGFEAARLRPGRNYGCLLQSIHRRRPPETRELNERLVQMGSTAGVDTRWNGRLLQKLERVLRAGFFPDPVRLLEVVR